MKTLTQRSAPLAAWILSCTVLLGLCLFWSSEITGDPIQKDARQNLTLAFNLLHHGVASLSENPPYLPSMYREPLPVFTTAIAIALADAALGRGTLEDYVGGERARLVKHENVFWAGLLIISAFWAVYLLTSSRILAGLAAILVSFDSLPLAQGGVSALGIDDLMTDLPAAAMLMAGSALLLSAYRSRRISRFALAGVCLGALALTKAAFLYVFVGLTAVLAGAAVLGFRRPELRIGAARLAALVVGFALVAPAWMLRNYIELGQFKIAERGGVILLIRAMEDGMSSMEYRGALYFWAPNRLQPLMGRLLGFSPRDLQRGGRLQRLNRSHKSDFYDDDDAAELAGKPEDAITFYREARAERVRLERLAADSGRSSAEVDAVLLNQALARIEEDPIRHLITTPLFLWRGAFVAFPVLALMLVYALMRREYGMSVFVLPVFGMIMFYALLSNFIPRYGLPASPFVVVCALTLAQRFAVGLRPARLRRARQSAEGSAEGADPSAVAIASLRSAATPTADV